jgi:tellurium resistance protein TerD
MINLTKGARVSLDKNVNFALVGLGWKANSFDGKDFDLDASVFMTDDNGKCKNSDTDFVFYSNKVGRNGCVKHMGDNLTGSSGNKDDEQIKIDFTKIPDDVKRLAIAVTIYDADTRAQTFGQVSNAYVHVASIPAMDAEIGTEQIRYDLEEDFSAETAVVAAEFYKKDGEWKFKAVGRGFNGGLKALCNNFGVDAQGQG